MLFIVILFAEFWAYLGKW